MLLRSHGNVKDTSIEWMPCKIHHDGQAEVDGFFRSTGRTRDGAALAASRAVPGPPDSHAPASDGVSEATFRGRRFVGRDVDLSQYGACAVVLQEGAPEQDDGDVRRTFHVRNTAPAIRYWNHDDEPMAFDRLPSALEFLAVAQAVRGAAVGGLQVALTAFRSPPATRPA